jgi:predicted short-subunit dehydrogenase-like oxidoreductase (DUF2520 family)
MLSLVILGTGNVASHLFTAIKKNSHLEIKQVYGRSSKSLLPFEKDVKTSNNNKKIVDADLYLIAVSDDSVPEVATFLKHKKGLVVHTSGSSSINVLPSERKGVFYPVQTFSKDRAIDFSVVPICLEANSDNDLKLLRTLAQTLSDSVFTINSEQRKKLHLAAVFINNFTNHFYQIGEKICADEAIPFDILKPLISETSQKISDMSASQAQTGPAKRNDIETMQAHLDMLKNPLHKKLYQLLSESIRISHEEKL